MCLSIWGERADLARDVGGSRTDSAVDIGQRFSRPSLSARRGGDSREPTRKDLWSTSRCTFSLETGFAQDGLSRVPLSSRSRPGALMAISYHPPGHASSAEVPVPRTDRSVSRRCAIRSWPVTTAAGGRRR